MIDLPLVRVQVRSASFLPEGPPAACVPAGLFLSMQQARGGGAWKAKT